MTDKDEVEGMLRAMLAQHDDFDKKLLKKVLSKNDFERFDDAVNCIDALYQKLSAKP